MKLSLISVCLIFMATLSFAQEEEKTKEFGIKVGANFSMFSASINSNSSMKVGPNFGVYIRTKQSEKLHIRTELYYSSQGQKDEFVTGNGNTVLGHATTTVNALNIPVLFEIGRRVMFQVGPQVGFLLSAQTDGRLNNVPINDNHKDDLKKIDVGLVAGIGVNIYKGLNLGVRYNLSVSPVFKEPDGAPQDYPTISNRVIHTYLAYSF